jgi:YD repeat-containing protein
VSQVAGVWDQQAKTYLSGVNYAPQGQPNWYQYGNHLCRAFTYNNRLQPVGSIDSEQPNASGSGTACTNPADEHLVLNWTWGTAANKNSGNLRQMDAWHGGPGYPQFLAFSETFQYDGVNRRISASDSGGWSRQFSYDQYGNMRVPNGTGVPVSGQTPPLQSFIDTSTNRIGGAIG